MTVAFFEDGQQILTNIQTRLSDAMRRACAYHGIDEADMQDYAARLLECEEAREWFAEWTGIEVVLNIAETEI